MKVIVCGGRGYADKERLYNVLTEVHQEQGITHLIHGAAPGADSLAGQWARDAGVQEVVCPANWNNYGRAAGPRRNLKMAELAPDLVIVFPGGHGTHNMATTAATRGLKVRYA